MFQVFVKTYILHIGYKTKVNIVTIYRISKDCKLLIKIVSDWKDDFYNFSFYYVNNLFSELKRYTLIFILQIKQFRSFKSVSRYVKF